MLQAFGRRGCLGKVADRCAGEWWTLILRYLVADLSVPGGRLVVSATATALGTKRTCRAFSSGFLPTGDLLVPLIDSAVHLQSFVTGGIPTTRPLLVV